MKQSIAYLDCSSGISGDMFLGAMLDAGFSLDTLKQALSALPIGGYTVKLEPFGDRGIHGSRFSVELDEPEQPERHLSDIATLIGASTLSVRVKERVMAIFGCLAEAEAVVHGTTPDAIHFHEVGAVDAIIDITGAVLALESLGISALYASPLPMSSGRIASSHGLLPIPAPATLEILRRVAAPWKPCPVEGELVTPTGAAILATLAHFETPPMRIEKIGYGFGQKRFPWPNCLRACLGTSLEEQEEGIAEIDYVTVIETNIDTMTGELLGGLMESLLAAGALDVSYTPIVMKKNRPAVQLTVISSVEMGESMASLILTESNTLGIRMQQMQRRKARREHRYVDTPLGRLAVKVKLLGQNVLSAAPEYEDCRRIAQERDIPLETVYEVARQAIERTIITKRG
jgi:uncharacterized protein (TIGR00299 family) protein